MINEIFKDLGEDKVLTIFWVVFGKAVRVKSNEPMALDRVRSGFDGKNPLIKSNYPGAICTGLSMERLMATKGMSNVSRASIKELRLLLKSL